MKTQSLRVFHLFADTKLVKYERCKGEQTHEARVVGGKKQRGGLMLINELSGEAIDELLFRTIY